MADIRPFRALYPASGLAGRIAALPYDVFDSEEARSITRKEPLSFLRIDRGETNFPPGQDMYAPQVYEKCGNLLQEWIQKGYFIQEMEEVCFLYELTMEGRVQTGIVALASVDEYDSGRIRRHEHTRREKEQDRIAHIRGCLAQTGPIYLTFRDHADIAGWMAEEKREALFDLTFEDGIRHRIFRVSDPAKLKDIRRAFTAIPRLYIADGHHRCASAVQVCHDWRRESPEYDREAPENFILSVLFPQSELTILPYHRIVRDLHGYTSEGFLKKVGEEFDLLAMEAPFQPENKGEFGMYLEGQWYRLRHRLAYAAHSAVQPCSGADNALAGAKNPVEALDVSLLQRSLLQPVLGIDDPRTDGRIGFVGGIRGLGTLEEKVRGGWKAAFSVKATTMEELLQAADANLMMPPKSTWFEPKLRSGFFLHPLQDNGKKGE